MKQIVTILTFFLFNFVGLSGYGQAPAIQWQNTIGGSGADDLYSIAQTSDGGYILGGRSASGISGDKTEASQGGYDYWVVKLDAAGAIQWQNTIGGSIYDYLQSIAQTSDGGYILGGRSQSGITGDKTEASQGNWDYWVVKLDAAGAIQWQNTIGGSNYDFLQSIAQTSDGGYILGGYSPSGISGDKTEASQGNFDYWVVKLDAAGAIQWQNTIGGSSTDVLFSIAQTTDGGYILGGYSQSGISGDKTEASQGNFDYWVVKLNAAGAIQWQNTIGGSGADQLRSIAQTSDGGYILGGYSQSGISGDKTEASQGSWDYWVVKLNAAGAIQWQNTIGGSSTDWLYSITQTSDGGYILGGLSQSGISGDKTEASQGGYDYWVVKLDAAGAIQWQNTIGGSYNDELQSIAQTSDGGYILGGLSQSGISGDKTEASQGSNDYWVVKLGCNVPSQPTSIQSSPYVCPNSSQTFSVTPVTGATDYTWTLPTGWTGTSTTNSITVNTTVVSGVIEVTANNGCGSSAVQTLNVTPLNCDDGVFCNGQEICDPNVGCVSGTPPNLDDGIPCTTDACDEATDAIIHTPDDLYCDDGDPNTVDSCDPATGCVNTLISSNNTWTGNAGTAWNNTGNWSSGAVPTGTTDALIPTSPAGGVFPELGINTAVVRDLEVQSGATVTIPATQALTLNGVLTNNGTVYVNNNGSLVQTTGSTLAGSGTYQVQRQGASGQRFNFWSSPIAGQGSVPGNPSYTYNSNVSTQDDSDDNPSDPGWSSYNGSMTPGAGYAGSGAGTVTFSGTVNNGNITVPLVYHAFDNTYTQTTPGTPFNIVGNPYPSAISAAQLITDNPTIDGTIYFWDDDLSGGSDYSRTDFAYWNGTGGLGTGAGSAGAPNGSISTAQGFYVRALSGGTLTFNNGQRVAGPNTQFLKPNGADSRLWFSIESADHFDQVLIGALEDATEEEDRLYDAIKMRSANGISLSAVGNDVEHAIMAFPPPAANKTIPLRVNTTASGTHTFTAQTVENFGEFAIYLDDAQTGNSYQLQEGVGIPVTLAAGEYLNRFYLNLVRTSFTGIEDAEESPLTAYAADGHLTVGCNGCAPDATIELLDMSGRVVLSERNPDFEGGMSVTDISTLSTGVYVVRVSTANQVFTQKVIKQ